MLFFCYFLVFVVWVSIFWFLVIFFVSIFWGALRVGVMRQICLQILLERAGSLSLSLSLFLSIYTLAYNTVFLFFFILKNVSSVIICVYDMFIQYN